MLRLRSIVSLLLVALWLPTSSHSLLESVGLIHERHTDHHEDATASHEHDGQRHEAADGKCAVAATRVAVPPLQLIALPLLFGPPQLESVSEFHVDPQPSGLAPPGTAPPQLSHGWQFSSRTALPARAPSLIS